MLRTPAYAEPRVPGGGRARLFEPTKTYVFEAVVYAQGATGVNNSATVTVHIAKSPLVALVSGGATRVVGFDQPLRVSAHAARRCG